ncbi:MAG: hypothetical protein FWB76_03885 [Oscillospiraceae bacterium]|nr:hypothetical protein [Oscillospiraceae bacterium]
MFTTVTNAWITFGAFLISIGFFLGGEPGIGAINLLFALGALWNFYFR